MEIGELDWDAERDANPEDVEEFSQQTHSNRISSRQESSSRQNQAEDEEL